MTRRERIAQLEVEVASLKLLVAKFSLLPSVVRQSEAREIMRQYPDWCEIVGKPLDGNSAPRETPYRKWLATKSKNYQSVLNSTASYAEVTSSISLFLRETNGA